VNLDENGDNVATTGVFTLEELGKRRKSTRHQEALEKDFSSTGLVSSREVPLKPVASPSYQPKPTPYNIAYRLNDCIGCFRGHDEDFWKVYHALLSKACYSEVTNYWGVTCGQQQDAMLVYDGMKLCLENGQMVVRAADCLYGAR
jgi:hypothetical protein